MNPTKDDLKRMDEASLINFIVAQISLDQKEVSPEKFLCSELPISLPVLINWKSRKGAPSLSQIIRIHEVTNYSFIKNWIVTRIEEMK
jgi:hypothetical protein